MIILSFTQVGVMTVSRSAAELDRIEKIEELQALGVTPYSYSFERTHAIKDALDLFAQEETAERLDGHRMAVELGEIALAGRLIGIRKHGKATFFDLADEESSVQLLVRKNVIGEKLFQQATLLDASDWVGVRGELMRTRTGEVTVNVQGLEVLSKAVRPLPFAKEIEGEQGTERVVAGLSDTGTRYRQRYADLAVNPEVREVFRTRSRMVSAIRGFLDQEGYLEMETPILQPIYGGALARPFVTHHNALDMPLYLRIADELYLKRLLVGGFERVYEIGKDFRNEGMDRSHNPEFTMLEFYEAFADYNIMMQRVEGLFRHVVSEIQPASGGKIEYQEQALDFSEDFQRIGYFDALAEACEEDVRSLDLEGLRELAHRNGIEEVGQMGEMALLDELFSGLVEPTLVQPTFVTDFPRVISPLAKPHREDPELAQRFELFVAGREIANAFSELNDPFDQRERFEAQVQARAEGESEAHEMDEDYLRAMEFGMPPAGGVGIGIDRLAMIVTDQASIRDVILFPTLRPE